MPALDLNDSTLLPRHNLCRRFISLIVLILVGATVTRPLLVELDPLFTYVGLVNCALALAVYAVVHGNRARAFEAQLILALGMVCLVPLLVVSGGVNSQFAFLIPIFPLSATMLSGNRLALVMCGVWLVVIGALTIAGPAVADLTGAGYHHGKSVSRGVWATITVLVSTAFGCYFQIIYDRLTRRLQEQATSDHLTGLANRRALERALEAELLRARRNDTWVSVLLLDVDHFKGFNDRFGHATGDRCLQAIGRCLRNATRAGQDLVGRYGGEEFLVVNSATDPSRAREVADKLRQAIAAIDPGEATGAAADIAIGPGAVTVTIGVASVRGGGVRPDQLIDQADRALYAGKAAGRNRVVHAESIAAAA